MGAARRNSAATQPDGLTVPTVQEIADLFGVNRRTVHDWRNAGMPLIQARTGYLIGPCVQWRDCDRAKRYLRAIETDRTREPFGEICSTLDTMQARLAHLETLLLGAMEDSNRGK